MSRDYYLYCKDCDKDYTLDILDKLAFFIEEHESHDIVYVDWCEKLAEQNRKARQKLLERCKVPDKGEIVSVISQFVHINLFGDEFTYIGKCPFHEDKEGYDDTFMVGKITQRFLCRDCGLNGDVNGFLKLWIEGKECNLYMGRRLPEERVKL